MRFFRESIIFYQILWLTVLSHFSPLSLNIHNWLAVLLLILYLSCFPVALPDCGTKDKKDPNACLREKILNKCSASELRATWGLSRDPAAIKVKVSAWMRIYYVPLKCTLKYMNIRKYTHDCIKMLVLSEHWWVAVSSHTVNECRCLAWTPQ